MRSLSLFFENLSFFARLFNNVVLNLNDLLYSHELENFEEILLENLAKIYSSSNFTLHSNFLVPFHSKFWKGIFLLKSQRNWNLYIFNYEMISNQQFNEEIFMSLLTDAEFFSIDIAKNQYNQMMNTFHKICQENSKIQELNSQISYEWDFDRDVLEFIDENKYHFTRYREFLVALCLVPSLVALISPEIFENIVTSHSDETIFSDFVNLLFQKSLLLNVPTLLPSHILKHKRFGKYITIESLGLLYYYLTDINFKKKREESDEMIKKIQDIHQFKVKTFNELHLKNNLNLCSLSCKSNIHKFLMKYWQNFKLKSPMEFYNNKFFALKDISKLKYIEEHEFYSYDDSILLNFYEKTQMAFKSFELDSLDDYYGELIIKTIQKLPYLKKIDLSGLNLGDNFCQLYSDFLLIRKINHVTSNLDINLSNNRRITNVGLKYLYVSFELSYCKQILNPKHKPKDFMSFNEFLPIVISSNLPETENLNLNLSGPTIDFDFDIRTSSSTTYILDNGLGSFILLKIKEYFWVKKKYCFTCDKEVCNKCHQDWSTHEGIENIKCQKPKAKDLDNSMTSECLKKEQERKVKESKYWKNRFKIILHYACIIPFLFKNLLMILMPVFRIAIIYMKKSEIAFQKWFSKLGQKNELKKNIDSKKPKTRFQKIKYFLLGYEEDPKLKEVTKFKYNYNVNVLNDIFGKKRVVLFYYLNLIIFYIISIIPQIYEDPYNCNIYFGIYGFLTLVIETIFIWKIIKIINDKQKDQLKTKNLIHNFSVKYYMPLLFGSVLEKYDFFTDIQFLIHLYNENEITLAHASLAILIFLVTINTIQLMIFTYDSFISSKEIVGIANDNINKFSMLSFQTHFKGIGFCLDLFSTKNAMKIGQYYVPQIMVSSISTCLFENIPQFIIQMSLLSNVEHVSPLVLYTIISTILSFIGAIKTALLAKGSVLTKKHLKDKFSSENFKVGRYGGQTFETESNFDEIPIENIAIKVEEKYLVNNQVESSPFNFKHQETGRELINSSK